MEKEVYVLAHNIRSMHNIGSFFRTSDAAGIKKIFLSGYTATPPRKEISKTALGAEEVIPWEFHKDPILLLENLKRDDVKLVALEKNDRSIDISNFQYSGKVCLILGHEIDGVSEEMQNICDDILHIPMRGMKESLNVSVAFGIAVYSLTQ